MVNSVSVSTTYLLTTLIWVVCTDYWPSSCIYSPSSHLISYCLCPGLACTIYVTKTLNPTSTQLRFYLQLSHRRIQCKVCWWLLLHSQWACGPQTKLKPNEYAVFRQISTRQIYDFNLYKRFFATFWILKIPNHWSLMITSQKICSQEYRKIIFCSTFISNM
jgi:hypothetical protein